MSATVRILSKFLVKRTGYHFPVGNSTYAHWCPGCASMHDFAVEQPFRNGAKWTFDGNVEKPTFGPSMNIHIGPDEEGKTDVCHYFLKDGKVQFLGDCTHALKNQTVDLPEVPAEALKWATIVREE